MICLKISGMEDGLTGFPAVAMGVGVRVRIWTGVEEGGSCVSVEVAVGSI